MSALSKIFSTMLRSLERDFNVFRRSSRIFSPRMPEVVPYLSYGTPEKLFIRGRVIEDKGLTLATPDASRWRNLADTYKRFVSDKVVGARIEVRYPGGVQELVSNENGYFEAWLEPTTPCERGWLELNYTLLSPKPKVRSVEKRLKQAEKQAKKGAQSSVKGAALELAAKKEKRQKLKQEDIPLVSAKGFVLIPKADAAYGVISDIDDTVVQTDVTRWLRVAGAVLFGNAHTRLPFRGVSAFYRALEQGTAAQERATNPLFYVSSSPWNLYDLLLEFFNLSHIPLGPLNLRDWRGGTGELFPTEHGGFKGREIRRILDTYEDLPFILIGDSGERDPEIYREIVAAYPGRILGVYIRNVSNEARSESVKKLAAEVQAHGSRLILADDTLAAAQHAVSESWINEVALGEVRAQKERDTAFLDTVFLDDEDTVATVIERKVRESRSSAL